MSQEMNSPTGEQQPKPVSTPGSQSPKPKKNNTLIYVVIIIVLLATNIYLFTSRNKLAGEKETSDMMAATADSSRSAVETDYNAALARLDELVGRNAEMDSMINSRNGEIERLKGQIQNILKDSRASAADLGKAKRLIAQLNTKTRSYEERIAELETENKTLVGKNEVLTHERDSTVTENIGLAQKVRLGAVLHASNIRMVPLDLRKGGQKQKETGKARKTDVIRIYFDIDENRIAESGTKEIFLRITGPDGNLLSNAAYGSGVTSTAEGGSLNYTLVKQISLQQNQPVKNVTIDWNQDSDYKKGSYGIEIYNEGHKIGSGTVALK